MFVDIMATSAGVAVGAGLIINVLSAIRFARRGMTLWVIANSIPPLVFIGFLVSLWLAQGR